MPPSESFSQDRTSLTVSIATTAAILIPLLIYIFSKWPSSIPVPPAGFMSSLPPPHRTHHPNLSASEKATLPYPPDILPGARDVDSPYGTMRVYEWGPADEPTRKVLLISGDTTPSPMLGNIAWGLVGKGCRVIMFDNWGRGESSTPILSNSKSNDKRKPSSFSGDPKIRPHTLQLYTHQILLSITTSPISWMTGQGISIIGFSLGGSMAMSFASQFPHLVQSLCLLAPGGILRTIPSDYEALYFWGRLIGIERLPRWWKRRKVARTLGVSADEPKNGEIGFEYDTVRKTMERAGKDELGSATVTRREDGYFGNSGTERKPKTGKNGHIDSEEKVVFDVPLAVQYEFTYHLGFVDSFISTIVHLGGAWGCHEEWRSVVRTLISNKKKTSSAGSSDTNEQSFSFRDNALTRLTLVFGSSDEVVKRSDTVSDLLQMFADEGVDGGKYISVEEVEGGHGFPVPKFRETLDIICREWAI